MPAKPTKDRIYDTARVNWLAEEVLKHKRQYYAGRPQISDFEYDHLEDELKAAAPSHPVLSVVGSDVGEMTSQKVVHTTPMLSLAKTYDQDELLRWAGSHRVLGMMKIDGTSMSLVYEEGKFTLAKTRGNGREGEDVTAKVKWITDVIPYIDQVGDHFQKSDINLPGPCEVRGEIYCREDRFAELSDEMFQLGLERPTSPRNIVAGVLGRKTSGELARFFNFFAFDVIGLPFTTENEKFAWLKRQGFHLPNPKILYSSEEIINYLAEVKELINDGNVGCDGAVFSYDELALHQELGVTSHHPRYKMSFKWQGQTAISTIQRIEWATSRLGIVTPVAVIAPVELSGATISNITLHNAAHVRAYQLKVGDKIQIVRSGEVIPKFLAVVETSKNQFSLPLDCPSCGHKLVAEEIRLRCTNSIKCPAQQLGAIINWIQAVGIDDLSDKRLSVMMEVNLVNAIPDLYRLTIQDFLKLPATKEKMAQKLFDHIQLTKTLPLAKFLNGLGIEGMGLASWEKLVECWGSLEKIRHATIDEIQAIEGFAEKSANQIVAGLVIMAPLIDELLAVGLQIVNPTNSGDQGIFKGKVFVITGSLSRPRAEVEMLIKAAGGRMGSAVSKQTSILVTNEENSGSSKMKKAKELGIAFWTEDQLWREVKSKS